MDLSGRSRQPSQELNKQERKRTREGRYMGIDNDERDMMKAVDVILGCSGQSLDVSMQMTLWISQGAVMMKYSFL